MKSFPWDEYTFYIITIERPVPQLKDALKQNGYHYMCDHGEIGDEM